MARIRCFLIEPTNRVRQRLRRYSGGGHWDAEQKKTIYSNPCPLSDGYHNASVQIEDAPARFSERGYVKNGTEGHPHDDPRWPSRCACGYEFQPGDEWQLDCDLVYRRVDTGDEYTLRDVPEGAMWRAPWYGNFIKSQDDGAPLVVRTPGGSWVIDDCSTSCPHHNAPPEGHHCWTRTGAPPDVTVTPSILIHGLREYHGWLRSGFLEDA